MKRVRFIFTVGALVLSAAVAFAQGGQDFSKVEIKANKVTDKFYTLDGQGGTIGVLIGPDGVFMVDVALPKSMPGGQRGPLGAKPSLASPAPCPRHVGDPPRDRVISVANSVQSLSLPQPLS